MIDEVGPNQYRCASCRGIFNFVRNETWSEEKANEEYEKLFPGESKENRELVCDYCWQTVVNPHIEVDVVK